MKKVLLLLVGSITIGIIVFRLNFNGDKPNQQLLMLQNIEALAGSESGEPNPCTITGGFCYTDGTIYWGISLL
ncbi:hypothetical protein [Butyricimonas sp.]|uniref:hypothetical protein n=1 Tax=Butyricimonas sp. TaxID=1969738 RepID=UPI0025C686A6|nr:hypothetical protein [Butyricimonas sp.]